MDDTREGHPRGSRQLYFIYARAHKVRELASIVSAEDLMETDRWFLKFARTFEKRYPRWGGMKNVRALKPSRPPGNERLSRLAPEQLARVSAIDLGKYRHWEHETKA